MAVDRELFADDLPTYLTRFVGRSEEIVTVSSLLERRRLVSICGVGGAGKTRLAIEVARRRRSVSGSETHWISLGRVSDASEVAAAVAAGIGLTGLVTDRAALSVAAALRLRRATIVLDNCEHVTDACRDLVDVVLTNARGVVFLTTTRVPIGHDGEHIYAIPPLSRVVGDAGAADDASALFVDRSILVAPAYELTPRNAAAIRDICDALHGLPLAIELAASWIRVLSADDLRDQIQQLHGRLKSDTAPVEGRHRSLDAVLGSSWELLTPSVRRVLSALGVFVGGFSRDAAQSVAGADLDSLVTLIDRALIQRLPAADGGTRFQMHELVRGYAWDQAEHRREVRARHAAYYADLVELLEHGSWNTPVEPAWSHPIGADLQNVDAAVQWAIAEGDAELALRLAVGLDAFWVFSSPSARLREARLVSALELPWQPASVTAIRARAQAQHVLGVKMINGDPAAAEIMLKQAVDLFESIHDHGGAAASLRDHGSACLRLGDLEQCWRDTRESLARCEAYDDRQGAAWSFLGLGFVDRDRGDIDAAIGDFNESRRRFHELGSPFGVCQAALELGRSYLDVGEWRLALQELRRVLDGVRVDRFTANTADLMEVLVVIAKVWHQLDDAARLCGAISTWRDTYEPVSWTGYQGNFRSTMTELRVELGERAWTAGFTTGRDLTPDATLRLTTDLIAKLDNQMAITASGLTGREVEILHLVSDGLSNTDIASRLYLSPRTVGAHLRSIFTKLDVNSRMELSAQRRISWPP